MGSQCYIVTHHTSHSYNMSEYDSRKEQGLDRRANLWKEKKERDNCGCGGDVGKEGGTFTMGEKGREGEASLDMGPGAIGLGRHGLSVGRGSTHGMGSTDVNNVEQGCQPWGGGVNSICFLYKLLK